MNKILVIGSTGQLGSELVIQFRKKGYEVFPMTHIDLDITDLDGIRNKISELKPNIIINASVYHVVPDCETYPVQAFLVNATALKYLADLCQEFNIHLVHYSTDYVFDGKKGSQYLENDAVSPVQVYGMTKYIGEQFCLNYHSKSTVIRTSGVYGGKEGSKAKKGNFILTIQNQIKNKETLEVASEQIVSPTYAVDLAKATQQLLEKANNLGIFHLVNEGYCSWAEFAAEIAFLNKNKIKIIPVDRGGGYVHPKRPLFSALSNIKAKNMGIILPHWKDALKRYLKEELSVI